MREKKRMFPYKRGSFINKNQNNSNKSLLYSLQKQVSYDDKRVFNGWYSSHYPHHPLWKKRRSRLARTPRCAGSPDRPSVCCWTLGLPPIEHLVLQVLRWKVREKLPYKLILVMFGHTVKLQLFIWNILLFTCDSFTLVTWCISTEVHMRTFFQNKGVFLIERVTT